MQARRGISEACGGGGGGVTAKAAAHRRQSLRQPRRPGRHTAGAFGQVPPPPPHSSPPPPLSLTSVEGEVLGRQALGAWNSRHRPRLLAAADAQPEAADAVLRRAAALLLEARGGGTGGVLAVWGASAALLRPLLSSAAFPSLVVVEPSADGAEDVAAALGLSGPQGGVHDGWERWLRAPADRRSGGAPAPDGCGPAEAQVYRGSPFGLTPPVLSLALDFGGGAVDLFGLCAAPPRLRLAYLRLLSDLLPPRPTALGAGGGGGGGGGGAVVLAAAVVSGGGAGDDGGGSGGGPFVMSEGELGALVEAAAGSLSLSRHVTLPASESLVIGGADGNGGVTINTLLLFERC